MRVSNGWGPILQGRLTRQTESFELRLEYSMEDK